MRPTAFAAILCSIVFAPVPAAAQAPPAEATDPDIVVTGQRVREEQVHDFVNALLPATRGSIVRMIDEVCPVAVGLAPAQNASVAPRLRKVAEAVELRPGPAGCVPNMVVVVTSDKRAFIEALRSRKSQYFGDLTAARIDRLARAPGPAVAWQLEGPVDADGIPLPWDETTGTYVNRTVAAASRIRTVGRRAFDAAVLVVESGALEGLTATQLADYAAMRLFARMDPARLPTPSPPTILKLLDAPFGSAVPITMTSWDVGLLRGLYKGTPDLSAGSQRSQIVDEIMNAEGAPRPTKAKPAPKAER